MKAQVEDGMGVGLFPALHVRPLAVSLADSAVEYKTSGSGKRRSRPVIAEVHCWIYFGALETVAAGCRSLERGSAAIDDLLRIRLLALRFGRTQYSESE